MISELCLRNGLRSNHPHIRALACEVKRLKDAIEKHRKSTVGHNSCWENDVELWKTVNPKAGFNHGSMPNPVEFLMECARYCEGHCKGN